MQDSIIGYLLGALDPEELERFENRLQVDPELQRQVATAAKSLQILRRDDDDIDPPAGLAESTVELVHGATSIPTSVLADRGLEGRTDDAWTLTDVVVACSVVLAACLLFFPAVNNSRYHAQIAGCQNNLRSIGRALIEYSLSNPEGTFPRVPESGNLAVAGMYAPTLLSNQLVTDDHQFFCPASTGSDNIIREIPKIDEIEKASGVTLQVVQVQMGGDYGYTLGFREGERVCAIRNQSRKNFPIMSDAPTAFDCSMSQKPRRRLARHRNVLFENGGVRVVAAEMDCWCGDQIFVNDNGQVCAGVNDDDAVIGASDATPVISLDQ